MDERGMKALQEEQPVISQRGFVTVATGNQKYYKLALNLLRSYRANGKSTVPFAIICDRVCPETQEFDDVIVLPNPHYSFLDKLSLYQYTPYQETIFFDADSLVLGDTDVLWDDFANMDDFSCYGRTLPLESRIGWFYYKDMGDLQSRIKYGISLHGGLYYLRKTERCRSIFDDAIELTKKYDQYTFYYFNKPADEPVLALSMVLADCKPCPARGRIIFFVNHEGEVRCTANGKLMLKGAPCEPAVVHFGTRNVSRFLYQYLLRNVEHILQGKSGVISTSERILLWLKCLPQEMKCKVKRFAKKHLSSKTVNKLKKLFSEG